MLTQVMEIGADDNTLGGEKELDRDGDSSDGDGTGGHSNRGTCLQFATPEKHGKLLEQANKRYRDNAEKMQL